MLLKMTILIMFVVTAFGEEQRTCYKCRVKNQCQELDPSSVEKCRPDVHHCVKKTIISKATGVSVVERYCGGRDFLDLSSDLVENKCYTDDIHGRTVATVCYCSTDYCNGGNHNRPIPAVLILLCGIVAALRL